MSEPEQTSKKKTLGFLGVGAVSVAALVARFADDGARLARTAAKSADEVVVSTKLGDDLARAASKADDVARASHALPSGASTAGDETVAAALDGFGMAGDVSDALDVYQSLKGETSVSRQKLTDVANGAQAGEGFERVAVVNLPWIVPPDGKTVQKPVYVYDWFPRSDWLKRELNRYGSGSGLESRAARFLKTLAATPPQQSIVDALQTNYAPDAEVLDWESWVQERHAEGDLVDAVGTLYGGQRFPVVVGVRTFAKLARLKVGDVIVRVPDSVRKIPKAEQGRPKKKDVWTIARRGVLIEQPVVNPIPYPFADSLPDGLDPIDAIGLTVARPEGE